MPFAVNAAARWACCVAGPARQDLVADRQHRGGGARHLVLLVAAVQMTAMRFARPLVRGTLVRRYKRFLADVMLEDGTAVTAHCANPGAMLGLNARRGRQSGSKPVDVPGRKLGHAWRLVELAGGGFVGIDASLPNRLVAEALADGRIPGPGGVRNGAAGGALRHAEPGRLRALRRGAARRVCRGQERPPEPRRRSGRVPRQRHSPEVPAISASSRRWSRRGTGR